jgi:hypothetical protein
MFYSSFSLRVLLGLDDWDKVGVLLRAIGDAV